MGRSRVWILDKASRERHLFGIRASAENAKRVPVTVSNPSISVRHLAARIVISII